MKNDYYKKALLRRGALGVILSLFLAGGIVMIPVGFANGLVPVGIVGIVLTVLGFYGCPMAWVSFGGLTEHRGVYALITEDGMRSATGIAAALGITVKRTKESIRCLISKRFLRGFAFDGVEYITAIGEDKSEEEKKARAAAALGKCPNCGATLVESDGKFRCPYCGSMFGNK